MSFATASCDLWQNEQRSESSEPREVFMREQLLRAPLPGRARTLNSNNHSLHRSKPHKRHVSAMGRLLEYGCLARYVAGSWCEALRGRTKAAHPIRMLATLLK